MSEPQDIIEDLMSRSGLEERETRAYYHLEQAEMLFAAIIGRQRYLFRSKCG
jgi:hypothetical protein